MSDPRLEGAHYLSVDGSAVRTKAVDLHSERHSSVRIVQGPASPVGSAPPLGVLCGDPGWLASGMSSQIWAVAVGPPPPSSPPAMRTRPSGRSVAL
jgi:hypothetical protein